MLDMPIPRRSESSGVTGEYDLWRKVPYPSAAIVPIARGSETMAVHLISVLCQGGRINIEQSADATFRGPCREIEAAIGRSEHLERYSSFVK